MTKCNIKSQGFVSTLLHLLQHLVISTEHAFLVAIFHVYSLNFNIITLKKVEGLIVHIVNFFGCRSLSTKDIEVIVGGGCPNLLRKAVNSAKRLRAYVRLDEGDVCDFPCL